MMTPKAFEEVFAERIREADSFYAELQREMPDLEARAIQRQALAGMLWSKQYYHFDVEQWLKGDPAQPSPPPERRKGRNSDWPHLNNADIILMPDKWEYPWYACWDLAFHCITFALIDPDFAKGQLLLLTREWYMHPSGQLPAYEWAFGDVNPPVHAAAALRVFEMDRALTASQTAPFWSGYFISSCSTSPGGSIARIAMDEISSKVAFSVLTISASSIARMLCRPAAI